LPLHLLVC